MHRKYGAAILGVATATALGAALVAPVGAASADPTNPGRPAQSQASPAASDHTEVGSDFNNGKPLDAAPGLAKALRKGVAQQKSAAAQATDPVVGDTRSWLAMDDTTGSIYRKDYVLRGLGDHIQVWVATDTKFPEGDCRNDLGMTDITDGQVDSFIHEFDTNIFPKESASFSTPPALNGSNNLIAGPDGSADYYQVSDDQADDIVTLVDNVRDSNFYNPDTPDGQTFIAGFFYSVFNAYLDRNIMTIDANDWLHRTGANPPDDSKDPAYVACATKQGYTRGYGAPRPHDYEGTFAHEYQHLLESYQDPDEVSWVNEGLSDYAQSLVGYVDTNLPPTDPDADSHLNCFQGYLPENYGGAENSLTLWNDQGGPEVLCDYGAAYSFMMYLYSHYGEGFMSDLHRAPGNGLTGLQKTLTKHHAKRTAMQTLHDWEAMVALDAAIDKSKVVHGGDKKLLTSSALQSSINWANPQSYSSPGAPPNGSDYVRLGTPGHWLNSKNIDRIAFSGAKSLKPDPVQWTSVTTPPDSATEASCGDTPAGTGAAALYSGCGDNLDRSMVRPVTVPKDGGTLSFDAQWNTEPAWDFAFVQVSTDNGKTWKSLATQDTTSEHDAGAIPGVVGNLPGFSGDSEGWKTQTADLSKYKGKKILVGFRYITDPGTTGPGFWVRNIKVGSVRLPSGSLTGWKTITQIQPQLVPSWTVQLVGIAGNKVTWAHTLKLNKNFQGSLSGKALTKALGKNTGTVAAIVSMNDRSETVNKYGRYSLTVKAPQKYAGRR